jgi:hypothetical protein
MHSCPNRELEPGGGDAISNCSRPATLDEWSARDGALEACTAHRIANLDASEARELTLEGVPWVHVEVAFESATPLSMTLAGAILEDGFVRLLPHESKEPAAPADPAGRAT